MKGQHILMLTTFIIRFFPIFLQLILRETFTKKKSVCLSKDTNDIHVYERLKMNSLLLHNHCRTISSKRTSDLPLCASDSVSFSSAFEDPLSFRSRLISKLSLFSRLLRSPSELTVSAGECFEADCSPSMSSVRSQQWSKLIQLDLNF